MKNSRTLRQVVVSLLLLVALLCQGTWALAGTTGSLSGTVTNDKGAPVAGAVVRAVAYSGSFASTTDAGGHYNFLTLAPDTYTVTVTKEGYNSTSTAGVSIFADQSLTLSFTITTSLKQIAQVAARAAGNLVKPGTTADVYSVNAAAQAATAGIGGGGNLDSAYSAIYAQPGVTAQIGVYGFGQVYYVRGSSYSQVGYEYDGIPVNRAFDNYNANSLSSLGSQETEIYTGGSPAGGTSATLGGYINQVIKTGTFPGYAQGVLGAGYPGFYHKASIEAGGATPDRLFNWYVGFQGSNQTYLVGNDGNFADQPIDGSGPNGISSTSFNPVAGVFTPYPNGPYPTCNAAGTVTVSGPFGLPVCNSYAPWQGSGFLSAGVDPLVTNDRENVMNFHFGIPHRSDAGRDDVQLLYYDFAYRQGFSGFQQQQGGLGYLNQNLPDWGGPNGIAAAFGYKNYNGEFGPYPNLCGYNAVLFGSGACATNNGDPLRFADSTMFVPGTGFGQPAATARTQTYFAPASQSHVPFGPIPVNTMDTIWNDGSVTKIQYQKNIGSNAYVRLMGYTFYSDWLQNGPNSAAQFITGYGYLDTGADYPSIDYELSSHTRGVQLVAADQINAQNLIQLTGNYTTSTTVRWNNQYYGAPSTVTNLVAGNNCYNYTTGALSNCLLSSTAGQFGNLVPGAPPAGSPAAKAGAQFVVTQPYIYGPRNSIQPEFSQLALQDEWRPTDRWDINAGIRFESYVYKLANSVNPETNFWFAQAANAYCYDPATGQPILIPVPPGSAPSAAGPVIDPNAKYSAPGLQPGLCYTQATPTSPVTPLLGPSGKQALHPNGKNGSVAFSDVSPNGFSHPLYSPRIGGTYTFGPDDVVRFNYGRFTQPTQTAYEQYVLTDGLGTAKFNFQHFWGLGFTSPAHNNPVQVSNNYDLSYEKHLKGTDWTFKASPFYRWTTNQLVTVSLGGNFASAINAATQQSYGLEFAVQKGDPTRNGFSGQLSYTYTSARIKYSTLPNGSNAIDVLNTYISAYNSLTKGGGGTPWYCVNGLGVNGSNGPAQNPGQCGGKKAIANPYYNNPVEGPLDRNGWYDAYANAPPQATPDFVTSTAIVPNAFAGYINYKHNRFSVTGNGILNEGNSYGSPIGVLGLDPRGCGSNQAHSVAGAAGQPWGGYANYLSCGFSPVASSGYLAIPNPQSGHFDGLGQYREPWQLNLGMQLAYDVTPRIKATVTLANVVNTCFAGSAEAWTKPYPPNNIVCAYGPNSLGYVGNQPGSGFFNGPNPQNIANGKFTYPGWMNTSYAPLYNALPFQAYANVTIKL